jgi:type IV secretion system protein VirB8
LSKDGEIDAYLREAASWDADRLQAAHRSERTAWWVAIAGWTCAIVAGVSLVLLVPLKRVEPFVVRVDAATGIVDVVPVYQGHAEVAETVTRYLLAHYVTVCERFNFPTAESDYQECGAFHTRQRNQAWYAAWNPSNPESPLNLYKDGTTLRARVLAVTFLKRANGLADLAQVHYTKSLQRSGGGSEQLTRWIATVQYAYTAPSQDPQTRSWNPLGFKIVDFRPEAEIVPDAGAAARAQGTSQPPQMQGVR